MAIAPPKVTFDEIYEFLLSAPSLEAVAHFKTSETLNERLHYLLDQNSDGTITPDERAELDNFLNINHFVGMLKIKAKLKLTGKE